MIVQSDASDEPGSGMKHCLKMPDDARCNSIKYGIAVVHPTDNEGLDNSAESLKCQ
jgi:hypothetical protein